MNTILSAAGLTKSFGGEPVLSGIDIDITEGSFTVVMGPSGSGKSTLLYALSGMDRVTSGSLALRGREISGLSEKEMTALRSREFGFIFQSSRLIKNLTLYENILVSALLAGLAEPEAKRRTDVLIKEMGVAGAAGRFPSEVSGGEAQRAAAVRAVVKQPSVLFADEPTGALNKANSREVLKLLSAQNRKGLTILMVTHDREAALYGSRILYLEDGSIKDELLPGPYREEDNGRRAVFDSWLEKQRW